MKLLVNGCSFTGGNDVVHDEEGVLAPIPDYVWSNYTGVDTTNIAIAGNSNDKIIRTTLEHLKQKDDYDGVIVQWTALYRLERYIEQYDVWGNICNKINVLHKEETSPEQVQQLDINNMFGLHFDKMEEDHNERVNTLSKVLQTASESYIWLNSDVDYKVKFLQDILVMQNKKNEKIVSVQIAGLVARRILSFVEKSTSLKAGERFGLIRFGSRVDVYMPLHYSTQLKEGDKVTAGESIIASSST